VDKGEKSPLLLLEFVVIARVSWWNAGKIMWLWGEGAGCCW